ncbi:MAG: tRNA epoxyqueuosine(34) reductase QueG [Vicingaceae bacterium]
MNAAENSLLIKRKAYELGFAFVGIAKAKRLDEDAERLGKWLESGHQAKMSYLNNHFEKRVDPRKLVPGTKSVISLLFNYHTHDKQEDPEAPKLAKYAYGKDYHFVIKERLKQLFLYIQERIGAVEGRYFVDSAPVLDRAWARETGLGWVGKNSMLINKQKGSDFFIASMMLDLELSYDQPIQDYCGTCTKCIESCPTDAIMENREINSNRCISYLTIELKEEDIPDEFAGKMNNWAFGCDICQDVCPWNRFAEQNTEESFQPKQTLMSLSKEQWFGMEKEQYQRLFQKSPVKRAKYSGLKRNLMFLKK